MPLISSGVDNYLPAEKPSPNIPKIFLVKGQPKGLGEGQDPSKTAIDPFY